MNHFLTFLLFTKICGLVCISAYIPYITCKVKSKVNYIWLTFVLLTFFCEALTLAELIHRIFYNGIQQ